MLTLGAVPMVSAPKKCIEPVIAFNPYGRRFTVPTEEALSNLKNNRELVMLECSEPTVDAQKKTFVLETACTYT